MKIPREALSNLFLFSEKEGNRPKKFGNPCVEPKQTKNKKYNKKLNSKIGIKLIFLID